MKFDGSTTDTLMPGSTGAIFQWGNNANLASASNNVNQTSRIANCTASDSTYSVSTNFILSEATAPAYDWCTTANNNLWGNTTNTLTARKGPCPTGYHIPNGGMDAAGSVYTAADNEWNTAYAIAASTTIGSCNGFSSNSYYQLRCILHLPRAGYRDYSDGSFYTQGAYGYYWSSSPSSTNARTADFYATSGNIATSNFRAYGFSARCLKN